MIFDHFNNDRYENISTFDRRNLVDSLFWFLLKEGNFTFFDVELFILFFNHILWARLLIDRFFDHFVSFLFSADAFRVFSLAFCIFSIERFFIVVVFLCFYVYFSCFQYYLTIFRFFGSIILGSLASRSREISSIFRE